MNKRLICVAALAAVTLALCASGHPSDRSGKGRDTVGSAVRAEVKTVAPAVVPDDPIALPACGNVAAAPAHHRAAPAMIPDDGNIAASVTNCVTYSMLGGDDPTGDHVNFSTGYFFNLDPMKNADGEPCVGLVQDVRPWPFVAIANSNRGTLVRVAVQDMPAYGLSEGDVVGEYLSSPNNMERSPSRTTVDAYGNIWITNRNEHGQLLNDGLGSVARIGLVLGGTRVDAAGNPDPNGDYLQGPFDYCTCEDRDGDGLIRTSIGYPHGTGAFNADYVPTFLPWPNTGNVDSPGGVSTALDECITAYVRVAGTGARFIGIDKRGDVWTGGTGNTWFELIDGDTAQVVPGSAFNSICGGYGGLIDKHDTIWSAWGLMRYDVPTGSPGSGTPLCLPDAHAYGVAIDPQTNHIWVTHWHNDPPYSYAAVIDPGTNNLVAKYPHGGNSAQGLVVDVNGNVWVAHSWVTVGRLLTDGTFIDSVPLNYGSISGSGTTGVAVDTNGKIWAANINTSNAMRIDPNDLTDSNAGSVDLVVDLGDQASPYNYSDMTGSVLLQAVAPQGHWTVIHDGGTAGAPWGVLTWNAFSEPGTSVTVRVRANDSVVPAGPWLTVSNGVPFSGVNGRYLQVQAILHRDAKTDGRVMLCDLTICQSAECAVVSNDQVLCDVDGPGTISYSFDLTNLSGVPVKHILVVPPVGASASPNIITENPSLPNGATTSITLNFTGVDTSEEFCFDLIMLSTEGQECCSIRICLSCPCLQIVSQSIECIDSATFYWSFDIHNNSGFKIAHVFLIPDDPGVTLTPNHFAVNVPDGGVAGLSTQVSGAAPGQPINVLITIHDPNLQECCTVERTIIAPDCEGKTDPDTCHLTASVQCCFPLDGDTTTVLTICNNSAAPATYGWDISALPVGGPCSATLPPEAFVPNAGVVTVNPGDCVSIPITIWCDYLYGQGLGTIACLQTNIQNFETGELLKCVGRARSNPQNAPCVIVLNPDPVEVLFPTTRTMEFVIHAPKEGPSWFPFYVLPGHHQMGVAGLPAGQPWWSYRWLEPGASVPVTASVRFDEHVPNVHDVLFYATDGTLMAAGAARSVLKGATQCPADLNNDLIVDVLDLLMLLDAWGPNAGHAADLNSDGEVDVLDLLIMLDAWGPCP